MSDTKLVVLNTNKEKTRRDKKLLRSCVECGNYTWKVVSYNDGEHCIECAACETFYPDCLVAIEDEA